MQDIRDLRRDPRTNHEMDVTLLSPAGNEIHRTHNISYRGVFIVCEDPLPLRTLLRVQTDVGNQEIHMLGLVAHRLSMKEAAQHGIAPGMGIELFSVGPEARDHWRHYVRQVYAEDPHANKRLKQKEYPHIKAIFPSVEALSFVAKEPILQGELFVRTAELYETGTRVWFETIHPESQSVFRVEAIISEVTETPRQNRGVTLAFSDPDAVSAALLQFVQTGQQS